MSSTVLLCLDQEDCWKEQVYECVSVYGVHILVGALLSAVTIYRRDMSCNRVFHEDDDDGVEQNKSRLGDWAKEQYSCEVDPADLLLDSAGHYCSGEPWLAAIAFFLLHSNLPADETIPTITKKTVTNTTTSSPKPIHDTGITELPTEVQAHLFSFLHPKDVCTMSTLSKPYQHLVDTHPTLWNTLWRRDYAWVVQEWEIGRQAMQRSLASHQQHLSMMITKEFYFSFAHSYMNYVLAGCNTTSQCLLGLHGHIYNLTGFVDEHPGSPDTLLVSAGKDATRYFEDMGHSTRARHLAQSLLVVQDLSVTTGWGLVRSTNNEQLPPLPSRKQARRGGNLLRIRQRFDREQGRLEQLLARRYPNLLAANPYFDPFQQCWKVWYCAANDGELETVFCTEDELLNSKEFR